MKGKINKLASALNRLNQEGFEVKTKYYRGSQEVEFTVDVPWKPSLVKSFHIVLDPSDNSLVFGVSLKNGEEYKIVSYKDFVAEVESDNW